MTEEQFWHCYNQLRVPVDDFRQEAVRLVVEEKMSWHEAGRRLSLAPSTIGNRVEAYKVGKLGEIGKTYRPLTEVEMELAKVKKENAELRMERDILKKLHDQGSQPG